MTYTVEITYEDGTVLEAVCTDYLTACRVLNELIGDSDVGEIIAG